MLNLSRVLYFTQKENDYSKLESIHRKLTELISQYEKLKVAHSDIKEWKMQNNTSIFEREYYIEKEGRKLTWNDVYKIVNSVKAQPYEFLKGYVRDNKYVMYLELH